MSDIWLFLSWDIAVPKNSKIVKNKSVLLSTWLINQVTQNKKIRLFWTLTKIFQQVQIEITQNLDKIIYHTIPSKVLKKACPYHLLTWQKRFSPCWLRLRIPKICIRNYVSLKLVLLITNQNFTCQGWHGKFKPSCTLNKNLKNFQKINHEVMNLKTMK